MPAPHPSSNVTLAVLAGGQSRRMGKPKAELKIGTQPILTYLLKRFCWEGPTLLVTAPSQCLPAGADLFDTVSTDAVPGQGPLRGVLTALEHAKTEFVVVTTVDMPAVDSEHLHYVHSLLLQRPRAEIVMLHQYDEPGAVEPFPSGYRCQPSAELIRGQLEAGMRAVSHLRQLAGVEVLPAPADWPQSTWANLNTPLDLSRFLRGRVSP